MKTLAPPARVWSPGAPRLGAARRAVGHAGLSRADRAARAPPAAGLRGRRGAVAAASGKPPRTGTEHKAGAPRRCARRRVRRSVPGLRAEAAAQMPAETLPAARSRASHRSLLPPLAPPAPARSSARRLGRRGARALDSCSGAPERQPHDAAAPPLSRSACLSVSSPPFSPTLLPEPLAAERDEGTPRSSQI